MNCADFANGFERMRDSHVGLVKEVQRFGGLQSTGGSVRYVDRREHPRIGVRRLGVDHQNGAETRANDALDRRSNENVSQQLLAMGPHDDKVCGGRFCGTQDRIEGIAGRDDEPTINTAQFRN